MSDDNKRLIRCAWEGYPIFGSTFADTPCPSPSPPAPPPPCHNFTSTSDLKKALQEFDADASTAEATYGAIAEWCVSAITDMHWLFYNLKNFNAGGVSNWDTSGVTDMNGMFRVRSTRAP